LKETVIGVLHPDGQIATILTLVTPEDSYPGYSWIGSSLVP
jgi:hypothetical protein